MASPCRRRISTPSNSASPSRTRSPAANARSPSMASVSRPSPPSTRTRSYRRTANVSASIVTDAARDRDRVVVGAGLDEQRPLHHAHRQRALDELALAGAGLGALQVAADPLRERARERGVGLVGDQQQVVVLGHGAAEQPLPRFCVLEQPVAQVLRGDARDLEPDRVAAARARTSARTAGRSARGSCPRSCAARHRRAGRRRTRASARTWSSRPRRTRRRAAPSRARARRPRR